jgi:hypothetical protein
VAETLSIFGPSSSSVATEELLENARLLERLANEASAIGTELIFIDRLTSLVALDIANAPVAAALAERDIDQAQILMVEIELGARGVSSGLTAAADGYSFVEQLLAVWGREAAGGIGSLIGSMLPTLALAALPTAGGALAALAVVSGLDPTGRDRVIAAGGREASRALTSAAASTLIRHAVSGADNAILASIRVPIPVARAIGDVVPGSGLGLAARATAGIGAIGGVLTESSVRLSSAESRDVSASPRSIVDRLDRIPEPTAENGAQVIIERFSVPNQPDAFAVYVGGTVSFDPNAESEPWDLTSNFSNAIGPGGGSYDSVVQAMAEAGVTADSTVQLTGYSQGAAVAALIAASGEYNVHSLASFGGPIGQVNLPAEIPAIIVEHRDDIVPAFGGYQSNDHAVIVEREVFAGRDIPMDEPLPAHQLAAYRETARLMEGSDDARLVDALRHIDSFGEGAISVEATAYRFERIQTARPRSEQTCG